MRIQINPTPTSIGNVDVYETFRVTQLDAGHCIQPTTKKAASPDSVAFSHEMLRVIENDLAIVVPTMDEHHTILEGVIQGIPNDCLVIIVSNSNPLNYQKERNMLKRFCRDTERPAIIAHQQDSLLAGVIYVAGLPELLSVRPTLDWLIKPRLRSGKGEAMMCGTILAKMKSKKYVGFVDADNLVPGSVHEYCKIYAAGLHYALTQAQTCAPGSKDVSVPLAMVRIKWNSKPKVKDGELHFEKSGRCSRVVNEWMNRYFNSVAGEQSNEDIVQTANAGEHAMTVDLALELQFATSYAVEPFQLVDLLERFGKPASGKMPDPTKVQVLQIESRNCHLHHCGKGEDHIKTMQVRGLSTIFHSSLLPKALKKQLRHFMKDEFSTVDSPMAGQTPDVSLVDSTGEPAKQRIYPAMKCLDWKCPVLEYYVEKMEKDMDRD